jgi:hypothetical protein
VTRSSLTRLIAAMMPKMKRPLTTVVRRMKEIKILCDRGDLNSIWLGFQAIADAMHCVQQGRIKGFVDGLAKGVNMAA